MQLKTIFNRITNYKPFVVSHAELIARDSAIHIELTMRARGNGRPLVLVVVIAVAGTTLSPHHVALISSRSG